MYAWEKIPTLLVLPHLLTRSLTYSHTHLLSSSVIDTHGRPFATTVILWRTQGSSFPTAKNNVRNTRHICIHATAYVYRIIYIYIYIYMKVSKPYEKRRFLSIQAFKLLRWELDAPLSRAVCKQTSPSFWSCLDHCRAAAQMSPKHRTPPRQPEFFKR